MRGRPHDFLLACSTSCTGVVVVSAGRLREAARVLRELAGAATPGPWRADVNAVRDGKARALALTYGGRSRADAALIASMDPVVAVLLADWLDVVADVWSHDEVHDADGDVMQFSESTDFYALVLAEKILEGRS